MCTYRYSALLWCALGRDMCFVFRAPLQSPHIHKYIYTYIHTYIYIHTFFCAPLLVATCVVIWLAALSKAWGSNETLHLHVFCTFHRLCPTHQVCAGACSSACVCAGACSSACLCAWYRGVGASKSIKALTTLSLYPWELSMRESVFLKPGWLERELRKIAQATQEGGPPISVQRRHKVGRHSVQNEHTISTKSV